MQPALVLFFSANLLYFFAYFVQEMLWLRVLSIAAAALTLPYFLLQPEVLYSAVFWQLCFLGINLINLGRLLFERRPIALSAEHQHLKNLVFGTFSFRDTQRLLQAARWHDATDGALVIAQGTNPEALFLLYSGVVQVEQDQRLLLRRSAGTFMGEVHYLTQQPASATVTCEGACRYLSWQPADLQRLFAGRPALRQSFESLLAMDVARKLQDQQLLERTV